jgi:hypothetical protein
MEVVVSTRNGRVIARGNFVNQINGYVATTQNNAGRNVTTNRDHRYEYIAIRQNNGQYVAVPRNLVAENAAVGQNNGNIPNIRTNTGNDAAQIVAMPERSGLLNWFRNHIASTKRIVVNAFWSAVSVAREFLDIALISERMVETGHNNQQYANVARHHRVANVNNGRAANAPKPYAKKIKAEEEEIVKTAETVLERPDTDELKEGEVAYIAGKINVCLKFAGKGADVTPIKHALILYVQSIFGCGTSVSVLGGIIVNRLSCSSTSVSDLRKLSADLNSWLSPSKQPSKVYASGKKKQSAHSNVITG